MFDLIKKCVEVIGEDKVIQFVTDSASIIVKADKLLMRMYPHIYWTTCAAHYIDLMLENIFKITKLKKKHAQVLWLVWIYLSEFWNSKYASMFHKIK